MSNQNTPDVKPAEKPARRRRLLKVLGVIVALLVVTVIMLPYVIPATWIAATVETALKSHVRGTVKLGAVSWGWLGGVRIDGMEIGQPGEFGAGTFLAVSRVNVHVRLLDLLRKRVTVTSVTVDSPKARITRNKQGAWNFEKILAGRQPKPRVTVASIAPAGGGFEVAVRRVRLMEGSVDFDDQMQGVSLMATGVNADLDADFSDPAVISGDAELSFDLVQTEGKGRFELAAADVIVPKNPSPQAVQQVAAKGTLTLTDIDVAELIAAIQPQFGRELAAGKLTLVLDYEAANGTLKARSRTGSLKSLMLGKAAGMPAQVAIGDATFAIDASGSQKPPGDVDAVLNSLMLKTAFLEINASGKASITQAGQVVSGKAAGSIDPAALPRELVQLPPELSVSGRAKFEASFEGNPQPGKFSASLDAGDLRLAYGSVARKEPGVAAAVSVSGVMTPATISADKLDVILSGGRITGSGTFDQVAKAAEWRMDADFEGVNVADYYPGSKPLAVAGGFKHTGRFFLGTSKRASDFVLETEFNNLSLDVKDNPGVEVGISGRESANSARAQATDLVVTVGGMPITVNADVQTPLEKPTGKITVRGREISVDSLMAVARALQSAVPAQPEPSGKPVEPTQADKDTAAKAQAAARAYVSNANVNLDLAIDKMTYQNFTGNNLVVDAGLVAGKVIVRKAAVDIFGGKADLTTTTNLLTSEMPFEASLMVGKVQARDVAQPFVSRWLPGIPISNAVDVSMSVSGKLGGQAEALLSSFNGKGTVEISDGTLVIGALPVPLTAALGIPSLDNVPVPSLKIPLDLQNGLMRYAFAVPAGKYKLSFDVEARLAGAFRQKVALVMPGTGQSIRLFSVENGRRIEVDPRELIADVAKAQLMGAIGPKVETQPGQEPSKEEQVLQGVGAVLDILTGKKEGEPQKPKGK